LRNQTAMHSFETSNSFDQWRTAFSLKGAKSRFRILLEGRTKEISTQVNWYVLIYSRTKSITQNISTASLLLHRIACSRLALLPSNSFCPFDPYRGGGRRLSLTIKMLRLTIEHDRSLRLTIKMSQTIKNDDHINLLEKNYLALTGENHFTFFEQLLLAFST